MAQSNDWFPSKLADQLVMFQNVKAKIGGYTAILPITAAQTTEITLICNEFIAVYNYLHNIYFGSFCKRTMPVVFL